MVDMYARGLSTRDIEDLLRGRQGEILLSKSVVSRCEKVALPEGCRVRSRSRHSTRRGAFALSGRSAGKWALFRPTGQRGNCDRASRRWLCTGPAERGARGTVRRSRTANAAPPPTDAMPGRGSRRAGRAAVCAR